MNDTFTDLPDTYELDQLVVDLPYVDVVMAELAGLGIFESHIVRKDSPELGLTLLANLNEMPPTLSTTVAPPRPASIDALLGELRRQFAARCGGWVPLMGKNRQVANVVGFPQPQSMTAVDPVPVPSPPKHDPTSEAGEGVRVGILDTRLYPHPDLLGRYYADDDAVLHLTTDEPVPVRAGHATFIADTVLAQAPGAQLEVRAVLDNEGHATTWDLAKSMVEFADADIDVLNLSLGCRTSDGVAPLVIARAVERLQPRMLIVAAAGNHGGMVNLTNGHTFRSPTWPAALAGVVAVSAHDGTGGAVPFGPRLPWINCTAPGLNLVGAYLDATVELSDGTQQRFTGYAQWSGTSFAAATVSGAVAARAASDKVPAREALDRLLHDPDSVVTPYVHQS